ncbi:MAG TPA: class I SAM-dependent methyltransferase [Thermomicrobiales bacterium]|nr:class I SAM-dependent methyltransferase [Thermomicrobiales bacterium]
MPQQQKPDPDGMLFDEIYATARGGDPRRIPWAHGVPHPLLLPWLEQADRPPAGRSRALVVGSGLGDDAEALAARGWVVVGFDISEAAIAWARERFPDSRVTYEVRSLFELPADWQGVFDLIVEIHTVQSLPVTRRQETVRAIANTMAPGGSLVVIAMTRDVHVPLRGRPWPLTEAELRSFERHGLIETGRFTADDPTRDYPGRVRCHFAHPA